jgi:hypothetical protein
MDVSDVAALVVFPIVAGGGVTVEGIVKEVTKVFNGCIRCLSGKFIPWSGSSRSSKARLNPAG